MNSGIASVVFDAQRHRVEITGAPAAAGSVAPVVNLDHRIVVAGQGADATAKAGDQCHVMGAGHQSPQKQAIASSSPSNISDCSAA